MTKKYFTGWEGQPLAEVFRLARELVEDPTYPTVKVWRADGGHVLGHFQVYFPEELAHAAGMLPVRIRGAQTDGTESESRFGSYLCSIIKTSLDIALTGNIELDLFVTHPICDAARNLAPIWGRNFDYKCQILYLPQNPNSIHAQTYLTNEYRRLLRDIQAVTGRAVSNDEIRRSIKLYDRSRALMRHLYAIRRSQPWLLSPDESMALIALSGILPRAEFIELLEAVIPQIKARPARQQDKMRVVFEGASARSRPSTCSRRWLGPAMSSMTISSSACASSSKTCATAPIRWPTSPRHTSSARAIARCSTISANPRNACCWSGSAVPVPRLQSWPRPRCASRAWRSRWRIRRP